MGLFGKRFHLSDAELLERCLEPVRLRMTAIRDASESIDFAEMVEIARGEFLKQYCKECGCRIDRPLKAKRAKEKETIYARIGPSLEKQVRTLALRKARSLRLGLINKVTAETLIFREAETWGLDCYHIECQRFRAKAYFRTWYGYNVCLIINYRDIRAGLLTEIIGGLHALVEAGAKVPCEFSCWKN